MVFCVMNRRCVHCVMYIMGKRIPFSDVRMELWGQRRCFQKSIRERYCQCPLAPMFKYIVSMHDTKKSVKVGNVYLVLC